MWSSESGVSAGWERPAERRRKATFPPHPRGTSRRADIMGTTADDMDNHRADAKAQESSTVRQQAVSPPVSPVGAREASQQAQRFTAKQHCGGAENARVVTPTPTSVVMLRRHFSKQRQAHERDAHDGVPPSPLDPLVFVKQPVGQVSAMTRASPLSAGCLASTRSRLLHFQVLNEPLKAAQRRLALALVAEKHPFDLDNTCLRLILKAQQAGKVSVAHTDAQSAGAPRADQSGAGGHLAPKSAHTDLTMNQAAGDVVPGAVANRAMLSVTCRPDPILLP